MQQDIRREFVKFSLAEGLFFAVFAIASYQTVFLQEMGLSSSRIGMIMSIGSVLGLITVPVWGMVSDFLHTAKGTFLVSVAGASILYCVMALSGNAMRGNPLFFYILIPCIMLFKQPSNSMLDSWCIGELAPKGISYGKVRMWGSIGYSFVSMILGAAVGNVIEVGKIFYFMLPMLLILIWVCTRGQKSENRYEHKTKTAEVQKFRFGALLKNQAFIVYLVYSFGLNIYLSVTLIFMPYILNASNCQAGQVGLVTGIRALLEICSMYLGSRLIKKIPIRYVMILPGLLFGLEHLLYRFSDNLAEILLIMVLSGLAGGFTYSLGPGYIYEIVPEEVSATAQSCNAMMMTLVSIIGTAAGGYIISQWGIHALTTGCGLLILGLTVVFTYSLAVGKKTEAV